MITQDVLDKLYGVNARYDELPLNTSILTTPTQIAPNDPARLHYFISNVGTHDILIFFDNTVATTKGILVPANGGLVTFDFKDHILYPTREVWAVGSGGTSTITFGSSRAT